MKEGFLIAIALVAFIVLWAWVYGKAANDCQAKGGVLVKGYSGMPECVAAPRTLP